MDKQRHDEIMAFRESLTREMQADVQKLRDYIEGRRKRELTPPEKAVSFRQKAWESIVGLFKKTK